MNRGIAIFTLFILIIGSLFGQSPKTFSIDYSKVIGPIKPLANVTAGPGESLQGYKDARIKMIRTNDYYGPCDFPYYTRFFKADSINPLFNPTDTSQYIWHETDSVISINYNNGLESFFRLGISYNLTNTSPYWDAPYDYGDTTYNNIGEVFKRTVMHYNDGWDNGFHYNIKYWNVWTEPDGGFWNHNQSSTTYFRMYEAVGNSIKSFDPGLKVGGAGFLSGSVVAHSTWLTDFISYCKDHNVPLDFFSWHLYGRHNPYSVYVYSQYIRSLLDTAGYKNTESIITETNIDLGNTNNPDLNSPKGAAWFASMLIAAQSAPLDRLIMYRGDKFMNLLNNDTLGIPNYTWNGLGFKSFSVLADEAPTQIDAQGSIFISDSAAMASDTTNLMIMASKTANSDSCYILISNYNSSYKDYILNITHLPWSTADSVKVTQYLTKPGTRFVDSTKNYAASDSIQISLHNMPSPSVVLLKISPIITTGVDDNSTLVNIFHLEQNYPNPFNPSTNITFDLPKASFVTLKIYNTLGMEIRTLVRKEMNAGKQKITFDATTLSSGVYFYQLSAGNATEIKKMILLK